MIMKILLFILFSSLLTAVTISESYTNVSVSEAKAMIDSTQSLIILDVRTQSEYDSGHIRNARLIPVDELQGRLTELNKADDVLVYCRTGARSAVASQILVDNGFLHVYNMVGGTTSWTTAGYPVFVKYPSIQEAVNNATEGSSILVSSGTYYERLVLNKTVSLMGENQNTTIADGGLMGNVMNVTASNVTVSGFTFQKSKLEDLSSGIYVGGGVAGVNISCNIVRENYVGILVFNSTDCSISLNTVFSNLDDGIRLRLCEDTAVSENLVFSNTFYGINLHTSDDSMVSGNIVSNNTYGICVNPNGDNNTVSCNSIFSNAYCGVGVYWFSDGNTVSDNIVMNNLIGIDFEWTSTDNAVLRNTVSNNDYGIWLIRVGGNLFLHNNFDRNTREVYSFDSVNVYDDDFEGNCWSSYAGTDSNQDGIGDSSYVLSENNVDGYPLMGEFSRFNVSLTDSVDVISNSTVVDFQFFEPNSTIKMHVSNVTAGQVFGFCRIRVPHALMNQTYHVTVDNADPFFVNFVLYDDGNSGWMYFSYQHSTFEIIITPEFQSLAAAIVFIMATLHACLFQRSLRKRLPI